MGFIREIKIEIGDYVDIDIIPRTTEAELAVKKSKKRKKEVCRPAQQNLNDKNSRRFLYWLIQGNFKRGDYYLTLTYKPKFKPKTVKQAKKDVNNFLEKLKYQIKKAGLQPLKYVYVTEFTEDEETGKLKNIHHHILIKKGISSDLVIDSWSKGRGKKKEAIGIVNLSFVQPDSDGLTAIANYFSKQKRWKKGCRRWSASLNLKRPYRSKRNHKYSKRKVESLALSNDNGYEYFRNQYKNYRITHIECKYYELTGWHIYLRAWRENEDEEGGRK